MHYAAKRGMICRKLHACFAAKCRHDLPQIAEQEIISALNCDKLPNSICHLNFSL